MARIRFAAAVLAGALLLRTITQRGLVNYDTLYTLVWGRQLAHGTLPDLDVAIAPTPHPLATLGAIVLSPLSSLEVGGLHGELAATAAVGVAFVSLSLLGWVVFALGREWFNAAAGLVAAAIVLTRVPVLDFGARAYVDIPYLVLVLGALLVETRRPRAGAPVAGAARARGAPAPRGVALQLRLPGLAARAGPARGRGGADPRRDPAPARRGAREPGAAERATVPGPPALAAAWRDAAPLIALAASGPLLWCLHDLLLTGDPLHSLTGTRDNAATLGRVTGLDDVPITLPRRLGEILREPVLLAAAGGGVMAVLWHRDRRTRLGVAAGALAVLAFCVLAAAGLPIITRYLLLTATLLAIFAGAGVFGWRDLPGGAQRTWWARFGALGLVVLALYVPSQANRIDRLGDALRRQESIQGDLARVVDRGVRCQPVAVPNRRPIPLLALWLKLDPGAIVDAQSGLPPRGTYLVPRTPKVASDYILDKRDLNRRVAPPSAGFRTVESNESWIAASRC